MDRFPKAVFDHLPNPIILIGASREIVDINRAARESFDIRRTGQDIAISLRNPDILRAVDSVLAEGGSREIETSIPDTPPRVIAAHAEHVGDTAELDGIAVVLSITDLTAIKRMEHMRADFVANASHELRSPLSAIIGFLETLGGPAKDDAEAHSRFIDIMLRESRRMNRLIDDLLSLSRVEINEHVQPTGAITIQPVLARVMETLNGKASERGMELKLIIADDVQTLQGDAEQLEQVFHNLVDNAIKYGAEKSPVTIHATSIERLPGRRIEGAAISVTNEGEGISQDAIPRLTERFYRVDKARSRTLDSTGLGLAICKHIISRHRGLLEIDSTIGKGSTFTVYLPVSPSDSRTTL
ncbi:MAG: PAS domain-containing sensor histidine kinase [Rhodospirillales bacterium]|nr:PAS domain-containing sensor histidine kinase [Rhodospirillales bacterium]